MVVCVAIIEAKEKCHVDLCPVSIPMWFVWLYGWMQPGRQRDGNPTKRTNESGDGRIMVIDATGIKTPISPMSHFGDKLSFKVMNLF
jgi:hypothetical protein